MADPLQSWPAFESAVRTRLDAGRLAYGDKSFSAEPATLVAELQQEALDLAGWGYVLWCRLEAMRLALLPARPPSEPPGRLVGYDRGRDAVTEPEQLP